MKPCFLWAVDFCERSALLGEPWQIFPLCHLLLYYSVVFRELMGNNFSRGSAFWSIDNFVAFCWFKRKKKILKPVPFKRENVSLMRELKHPMATNADILAVSVMLCVQISVTSMDVGLLLSMKAVVLNWWPLEAFTVSKRKICIYNNLLNHLL